MFYWLRRRLAQKQSWLGRSGQNSLFSVIVYGTRALLQIAIGIILARLLLPGALGRYSFAMALFAMGAVIAQFGMTTLLQREVPTARACGDRHRLRALWRLSIATGIVGCSIVIGMLTAAGWFWGSSIPAFDHAIFFYGLTILPLAVAINLGEAALQGAGRPVRGAIPAQVVRPALFVFALLTSVTLGVDPTPRDAIGMQIAAHSLVLIVIVVFWRQEAVRQDQALSSDKTSSFPATAWLRSSASFLLIHGMWIIMSNTGLIMVGALSDAEQTGLYKVATSAAVLSFLGMQALNPIMNERISWYIARNNTAGLQRIVRIGGACALALAAPLTLVFAFAGEDFIQVLFGERYTSAAMPLLILAVGQTLHVAAGYAPSYLAMSGNERANVLILIASASLNILLNFLLIPSWGASGAALSTAVAITLQAWLMWGWAYVRNGIDTSPVFWVVLRRGLSLKKDNDYV